MGPGAWGPSENLEEGRRTCVLFRELQPRGVGKGCPGYNGRCARMLWSLQYPLSMTQAWGTESVEAQENHLG